MALADELVELTFSLAALEFTNGSPELILPNKASIIGEVGVSALKPFDAAVVVLADWVSQGGDGAAGFDEVTEVDRPVEPLEDCPVNSDSKANGSSETVTTYLHPESKRSPHSETHVYDPRLLYFSKFLGNPLRHFATHLGRRNQSGNGELV